MGEEQQSAPAPTQTPAAKGGGAGKVILIVIILLIVVLGGGYVAYAKLVKKASSLSQILSPASTLKLNPNCRFDDPDLCKFMNNWKDVKYMTMSSESTDKDGVKSKTSLKTEGTDKSQMILEQGGKETYNVINIGNTSYTKDYTDNKWFKYTYEPTNDQTEDVKIDFKVDDVADKTTYKKIGTEACGKLTCFKYQVIDPAITDYTEYIYFDNKEYSLRKTRSEGKDGAIDEATFDYGKVSISEPSPTKEGNPFSIPETDLPAQSSSSPVSQEEVNSWLNELNESVSSETTDTTPPETEADIAPVE